MTDKDRNAFSIPRLTQWYRHVGVETFGHMRGFILERLHFGWEGYTAMQAFGATKFIKEMQDYIIHSGKGEPDIMHPYTPKPRTIFVHQVEVEILDDPIYEFRCFTYLGGVGLVFEVDEALHNASFPLTHTEFKKLPWAHTSEVITHVED